MTDPVTWKIDDGVAVIRLDDGKVNAVSHEVIDNLHKALDEAASSAHAVCLTGHDRTFSAGFDLSVMTSSAEAARELVGAGARLLMRLYGHPQPTVAAVTGHALAMGSLLALACDVRIGGDGKSKIGLNEVAIGMGLPVFATELARERLSKRHLTRATALAEIYDPAGAVEAGYLDRVVPAGECVQTAIDEARRLGAYRAGAVSHTKENLRGETIARVLAALDDDLSTVVAVSAPS